MRKSVIELRSVEKIKNGKAILKDITFTILRSEIFVLMGPSGSGKTSLLRLLNRLEEPSRGEILFQGMPIREINVLELRRRVGMVFQIPVLFEGTVEDNIRWAADFFGLAVDPPRLLKLVGLEETLLMRDARELSVGQAQRVCIARSLAMNPDVLLLDEPTASLDLTSTLEIEELLKDLRDSTGLTMVFVTHDIEQVKRIGDRGMLLIEGRMVEQGRLREILKRPASEELDKFLKGVLK